MGNLKSQGFRLMVNKRSQRAEWVHPADVRNYFGYTDTTDMTDEDFDLFMGAPAAEVIA